MTVGEKIKKLRKDRNISQKDLAVLAGIPVVTLQQYERGVRTQPRIEQLQKIAIALDVPISSLLGADDSSTDRPFSSTALEWAFQENAQGKDIGSDNLASRANELRRQNKDRHRVILSQEEVDKQISDAEQEHKDYLEMLCFDPTIPDEDYPARIRYVTSFIEKNADTLKLAMPGTHMLPDDIEEAKKIRAAGGTPDSSK